LRRRREIERQWDQQKQRRGDLLGGSWTGPEYGADGDQKEAGGHYELHHPLGDPQRQYRSAFRLRKHELVTGPAECRGDGGG
jgi:hypothetical protein